MKKLNKGFTLIELLVVIAIIGILSAVVLASLNSARTKGQDAAIKANMNNLRSQAALLYDTYNHYGNGIAAPYAVVDCPTTGYSVFGSTTAMVSGVNSNSGSIAKCVTDATSATVGFTQAWVMMSPLRTTGAGFWCIDSSGASKAEASALGSTLTSSTMVCP